MFGLFAIIFIHGNFIINLFTYLNYKMKKITNKYNYEYLELNNILKNNPNLLEKNNNFELNDHGYNEISKIIVEKLKKY